MFKKEAAVAAVRLFKAIPEFRNTVGMNVRWHQMMAKGFLIVDRNGCLVDGVPQDVFDIINSIYGVDAILFNQTFYHTFDYVAEMSLEERLLDQILHYMSTYGREAIGLNSVPYLPFKKLNLDQFPGLKEHMTIKKDKLILIQMVNEADMSALVNNLVQTVAAPSDIIKHHFNILIPYITVGEQDIKSFELKAMYYDYLNITPTGNIDFLRYAVYKTTGNPMLIKDANTISRIKAMANSYTTREKIQTLFKSANRASLAEIFYRYKPLFLAFKKYPEVGPIINDIRRKAVDNHRPLTQNALQNVINMYLDGKYEAAMRIIDNASNRDLVKLMNSLAATLTVSEENPENIRVFSIRNGKSFVKVSEKVTKIPQRIRLLGVINEKLSTRLEAKYENAVFVIPDYIEYTAPTSEKQMVDVYPWGTKIVGLDYKKPVTAGIHWKNGEGKGGRTDLDLHAMLACGAHVGWNGSYANGTVIYSGDITDAPEPHGAAEAFRFVPQEDLIFTINKYSGPKEVPFKLFFTAQEFEPHRRNFVFAPDEVVLPVIPMKFTDSNYAEFTVGAFLDGVFNFYGGRLGSGIVPKGNYSDFIKGIKNKVTGMYFIRELLEEAGATVVNTVPEGKVYDMDGNEKPVIDLSPEALTTTTLFEVVDGTICDKKIAEIEANKKRQEDAAIAAMSKSVARRIAVMRGE